MKTPEEVTIPKIINIADVDRTLCEPTLLHFTAEQWKELSEGVKEADKLAEGSPRLEVVPMPGGHKMILAAMSPCPPDCTPLYVYRGSTPDDFEQILFACYCDAGGITDQPSTECRPVIQFKRGLPGQATAGSFRFVCVDSSGKPCPDYEPAWFPRPGGGYIYGCKHK